MTLDHPLSAREREILNIVYRLGDATATEVIAAMKDPPSRSAVRTFLKILEDKGHLRHKQVGREFVFSATRSRDKVGRSAIVHVLETFFGGSLSDAVASYLAKPQANVDEAELKKLQRLIDIARKGERKS
ncbi:MAG: BlaI/MecI/CopY family transcriptional regulator [Pirellulaceae bacterium]|nr:BlaI/MecI/CopY family transcriptional regulator [Pirellulaceae bacterium]